MILTKTIEENVLVMFVQCWTYGPGQQIMREGNLLPLLHGQRFISIISDMTAHTDAFVTPVVEHWLELETTQWVHQVESV